MHPAMRSLYELQQLDRYIAELRRTLEKLDPGDHIQEEIQRQRAILEQIKREYDTLHAEAVDQELQLRQMDEKFREVERELYSGRITNPKELAALQGDLDYLKRRRSDLDIRLLEMWDKMETLRQQINQSQERMNEIEMRYEAYRQEYEYRKASLESEIRFHEQQRDELARQIDPEALAVLRTHPRAIGRNCHRQSGESRMRLLPHRANPLSAEAAGAGHRTHHL
jgi:uncharacterized protein